MGGGEVPVMKSTEATFETSLFAQQDPRVMTAHAERLRAIFEMPNVPRLICMKWHSQLST
jgi:hypothetical protein